MFLSSMTFSAFEIDAPLVTVITFGFMYSRIRMRHLMNPTPRCVGSIPDP